MKCNRVGVFLVLHHAQSGWRSLLIADYQSYPLLLEGERLRRRGSYSSSHGEIRRRDQSHLASIVWGRIHRAQTRGYRAAGRQYCKQRPSKTSGFGYVANTQSEPC